MLEELTPDSVYSAIMMEEPQPVAVLLVEGPDDDMILGDHLRRGVIGIVCGNRSVAISATEISHQEGRENVFALVDRDLVPEVVGTELTHPAVVTTSAYDLTADLAAECPGAIKMALMSLAHREARVVSERRGDDIEHVIIEIATVFAGIRVAVLREGYPVRLDGFNFAKVLGAQFETLGVEVFAENLVITKPQSFSWSAASVESLRNSVLKHGGARELCGGHDLAGVAHGLVVAAGGRQFSKRSFEAAIRVHARCEVLTKLDCVLELQRLSQAATGLSLFDCEPAA
ncbi:hypothetical protein [Microbacterium sp. SS28]|uniref:hypothetical protein n=1 Tax=Microbacterium sp. SS28 TaxID=2919948 RepID=UPI001FAAD87A|nr:hypothetical protein [Microbacterium sp. SS28]